MPQPKPRFPEYQIPHESPIAMLSVDGGPMCGAKAWASFGGTCLVGRGCSCDLCIVDPRMSREHFAVSQAAGRWVVCDLNSSNGTFLNDRRIDGEAAIHAGDVVVAGDTRFLIRFVSQSESTGPHRRPGLRESAND